MRACTKHRAAHMGRPRGRRAAVECVSRRVWEEGCLTLVSSFNGADGRKQVLAARRQPPRHRASPARWVPRLDRPPDIKPAKAVAQCALFIFRLIFYGLPSIYHAPTRRVLASSTGFFVVGTLDCGAGRPTLRSAEIMRAGAHHSCLPCLSARTAYSLSRVL